jgi:hypothetical protein
MNNTEYEMIQYYKSQLKEVVNDKLKECLTGIRIWSDDDGTNEYIDKVLGENDA